MKKTYLTPAIKVKEIGTEDLLAASPTDINDVTGNGNQQSKENFFMTDDVESQIVSTYNAWEVDE